VTKELIEIRKASIFISHIRFSLNICVAIFAGVFLVAKGKYNNYVKFLLLSAIVWLLVFLTIIEAMTGLIIVFVVLSVSILLWIFRQNNLTPRLALIALLLFIPTVLFFYVRGIYLETLPKEELNLATLDQFSARGNKYFTDTANLTVENGYYVGLYIQNEELREAWNKRSHYDFDGHDSLGQILRFTLYRFLTSKGLRKDFNGVQQLNDEEVKAVEKGIANVDQMAESSIRTRIKTIFWEFQVYNKQGYFSGHSVTQRIEFWHASLRIMGKHFWFGTGTGDIGNAFEQEYDEMQTSLSKNVRWRSHNQYLSIFVALGFTGFLLFIFILLAPGVLTGMYRDYFYLVFMMVLLLSMLTEDTLESQAGVTFYAFFTSFFLFARTGPESLFDRKDAREDVN
jgi:O-antigen ligase